MAERPPLENGTTEPRVRIPGRRETSALRVPAAACALYSLGILVPTVDALLSPAPVIQCEVPPCPQPGKHWGEILPQLATGLALLGPGAAIALTARRFPTPARILTGLLFLVCLFLAASSILPRLLSLVIAETGNGSTSALYPQVIPPEYSLGFGVLAISLAVALLLSLRCRRRRSTRTAPLTVAQTLLLLSLVSWCGICGDTLLSAVEIGRLADDSASGYPDLSWSAHTRVVLLLLAQVVLATVALVLTEAARWSTRRPALAAALTVQMLLLGVLLLTGSGILQLVGWTTLGQGPQLPLSAAGLSALFAIVLTAVALAPRRRSAKGPTIAEPGSPDQGHPSSGAP